MVQHIKLGIYGSTSYIRLAYNKWLIKVGKD